MLTTRKLVLDTFSEVYSLLKPYATNEFWDLTQHTIVPGATYVVGRKQCIDNREQLLALSAAGTIQLVISNPHEGSQTLAGQMTRLGFKNANIKLIGGGDMPSDWDYIRYDKFLPEILDYEENSIAATASAEIYSKIQKPYQFLCLNGRARPHRADLIRKLAAGSLLNNSLWTNLDSGNGPVQTLHPAYEVPRYRNNSTTDHYVKFELFNNEWGEIYLEPAPYIDTYFSLVTETVFDIPYSFRTEKIWKPIVMGHPWITVANAGFYRDMRNLGFQTYSHVLDESFDTIENNADRMDRIVEVVNDLCKQDLADFLKECYNTSKYNQQHHREMAAKVRKEFPERFFQFINDRSRIPPASTGQTFT
jgi:hypothetical protein